MTHHELNRRGFLATIATGGLATQLPLALEAAAPATAPAPAASSTTGAITADTLAAGEKLAGLAFTPAQREPLVKTVVERATAYAELRQPALGNEVFPSLTFNPLQSGLPRPDATVQRLGATWTPVDTPRPVDEDVLAFLPVARLASLLRAGRITSRELTELALRRLRRFDPALSAVVNLTEARALRQADAADAELRAGRWRGPLHGIPWGAKDLLAVRGYPTTWGAAQFKDRHIDEDAEVVRRLDAAGAVLVAKLTLGALANGDNWFGGQTKCPWNLATGSSGSSAGPCAAVAAGLVPFAIGSETLGSIVSPCTRNGVTGLRPSYGRVSRAGAMSLSWSMDKLGPIARTAEDCALIFDAIHGADPGDPTAVDAAFPWKPAPDLRGERIGYVPAHFEAPGAWADANQAALETLRRLGAELVPITQPQAPFAALRITLSAEAAAAFDAFTLDGSVDDIVAPRPSSWNTSLRAARFIPAVEYLQANRLRTLLVRDLEKILIDARADVWVTPPFAGDNLLMTNLTGHPTVCLPHGFQRVKEAPADSPRRTAGSLTFNARLYRDDRALAVAHAFQTATDFHRRRPPIV